MSIADREPPVCPDWDLWRVFTMATRSLRAFSSSSTIRSFTWALSFRYSGCSSLSVLTPDEIIENDFIETLGRSDDCAGRRPCSRLCWGLCWFLCCGCRLVLRDDRCRWRGGRDAECSLVKPTGLEIAQHFLVL